MLEYSTHGAAGDVVLVHGAGGNNLLWKRTLGYMDGPRRAVAVNLPGHPSGDITCTSVADYAVALHQFVLESGLEKPVICGHSMGSAITLQLALDHPEDLGGMVLVGAGAKLGVDPRIVEGLRDHPLKTIEQTITPMSFRAIDLELGREARAALSFTNLPVFLNDYLACEGFDVRSELHRITARTLIICGEEDRMTPPKWSQYLNEKIPSSTASFVKESGHMLPLEKPQALAGLIQPFLSGFNR
ncbi:MAG: alpha/beta hydrolase [Thaumarchaeota archaeon]|nr:alpha/beta hydrolase [Nitrososphaerota archaeon]